MAFFRGNTPVSVMRAKDSGSDLYGQPVMPKAVSTKVQVIKFLDNSTQTPLRQEMSATHGRVDDEVAAAILLFDANFDINMDDIVTLFGTTLVVDGVWPQPNTLGKIIHRRAQLHRKVL
jgi:hypothetical protein